MQDYTFETLANGEKATVPHSTTAVVETTYPDGIFPHYIVRDPRKDGEYLYVGENHRMATSAATYWNLHEL